ncbi:hypothetical protein RBU61_09435 [Tissierella sp. MB52-C2]|uniref:hypothetical protein n=1 Tax=Tissierella sp. MB52-C2 TaxID=3070999 RepID=UPI00280B5A80|nr:hypothetical protein [Tissierella sp. MB52-C2]WMM26873.1 hypothetical protein RBU61_09435 [Tissierella sp. MB52-C2]
MDNKILIFLFLLVLGKNQETESTALHSLGNFVNTLEVDPEYTAEKIKVVKKVGAYFPEHYIPLINKSILFTERLVKINELANFMKNDEYAYIKEPISVNNNKERISKVVNVIQNEVPKTEVKNLGMMMDLIINMDKYKQMFSMLTSVMGNQDALKDPTQLIGMLAPIMGGDSQQNGDKMKEMSKMMEIMKALNAPTPKNEERKAK